MFFLRSSVLGVPVIPTNTMKKMRSKNMKQHKIRRKTPKCGLYFLSDCMYYVCMIIAYHNRVWINRVRRLPILHVVS